MELEELRTFLCLARTMSFIRAAEELHVAQPTVSARLSRLEDEVGQALLYRTTKYVELTEAGRMFLPFVERALALLQEGEEGLRGLREGVPGRLVLACTPTINYRDLPGILAALRREHPALKVSVRTGRTQFVAEQVLDGAAHAGLLRSPFSHPGIRAVGLYREEVVLVVPPGHPLAAREAVRLADLRGETILAHDSSTRSGELALRALQAEGLAGNVCMEIDYVETVKEMVARWMGVAILPATTVEEEARAGRLAAVRLLDPPFRREVLLIYHARRECSSEVRTVLRLLRRLYAVPGWASKA